MKLVVIGGGALAGLAILGSIVGHTPTAAPASSQAPITVSGSRTTNSQLFDLSGGNYTLDWQAAGKPGCEHSSDLRSEDGKPVVYVPSAQQVTSGTGAGQTHANHVRSGRYYVSTISGCDQWSVTIAEAR